MLSLSVAIFARISQSLASQQHSAACFAVARAPRSLDRKPAQQGPQRTAVAGRLPLQPVAGSASGRRSWLSDLLHLLVLIPCCSALASEVSRAADTKASQALSVIQRCRTTVVDLLENYADIQKRGGDGVRRYLGTVGTTSPLSPGPGMPGPLQAAYKALAEDTGETEILELADEVSRHLREADSLAYSSNFANFSAMNGSQRCNGGDCTAVFLKDAKEQVQEGLRALDKLLEATVTQ